MIHFFYTFIGAVILFLVGIGFYAVYEIAKMIGNPVVVVITIVLTIFFLMFSYWISVGVFGPPDDYNGL